MRIDTAPLRDIREELAPDFEFYTAHEMVRPWRSIFDLVFNPRSFAALGCFAALTLALLVLFRGSWSVALAVPVALIALVPPFCLFLWHCDTTEIGRHSLQNETQLRLGFGMLSLFSFDRYWTLRFVPLRTEQARNASPGSRAAIETPPTV